LADQLTPSTAIPIKVVQVDQAGAFLTGNAVTMADNANIVQGALADAAIITDTTGTINGKLRGLVKWAFERMPASLAQKTMANSLPVVIASDQTAVAVTLGSTTLTATVQPAGVAAVVSGRQVVTTAGTAVQLSAQACKSVALTAAAANTGVVVLGDSTVVAAAGTRKGLPLAAGDTAITSVSNMNLLWMDSTVNGEGVSWLVLN